MIIYRTDDRLVHGQIVEGWVPFYNINSIVVVSDEIADDGLRKAIFKVATPMDVEIDFLKLSEILSYYFVEERNYLVLFQSLYDVLRVLNLGFKIDRLNLGGIHYAKGRDISLGKAVFLSEEEKKLLDEIISKGVDVYMQAIPQEKEVRVR